MNTDLKSKKCEPCEGNSAKLTQEEIANYLSKINSWSLNDDSEMIFKKYKFKTFKKSLNFINQISEVAEKEGHHPDISFGWGYAIIMIHTHSIKGLSINDFILASKIDAISL